MPRTIESECEFAGDEYLPSDHLLKIPASAHTLAGFEAWLESPDVPEYGRIEFCDGWVLVDMSPERTGHAVVKFEICRILQNREIGRGVGEVFCDGPGYVSDELNFLCVPDGMFVRGASIESGAVSGGVEGDRPTCFAGRVDWILQVISPSSVGKDRKLWFERYESAGVGEYWIVDARKAPTKFWVFVLRNGKFEEQPFADGWVESEVFGASFKLERGTSQGEDRHRLLVREATSAPSSPPSDA